MKTKLLYGLFCICFINIALGQNPVTNTSDWSVTNLTSQNALDFPYTLLNGPDGSLWVTERKGKKVVRVDKINGNVSTILDLSTLPFDATYLNPPVHQTKGQDGLMGMAIHPDLYTDIATTMNNYVYLAYTYDIDPSDDNNNNSDGDVDRRLRIVRYTYNNNSGTLDINSHFTIINDVDASNDHNSGKLVFGPDLKLYYSIGDQGANQFANACKSIRSQDLPTTSGNINSYKEFYKGKMLRFNLDGSIPNDNPMFNGVQSHIYTYGHRNAQGVAFSSTGKLYSSEHGGKTDDEINIIEEGKNYGWPEIAGGYDNNGYTYCNWSSTPGGCPSSGFSDHNCPSGQTAMSEYDSFPQNPGVPADFVGPIGTYGSTTANEPSGGYLSWPTVAPSGIAIYEGGLIPDWGTSLLIPTLKRGTIFRVKLDAMGDNIEGNPSLMDGTVYEEWHSSNDRYRDVIADPNGTTFWAITDNSGGTSGPSGTSNVGVTNMGVVMKIEFVGQTLSNNNFALNDFKMYPNPTDKNITISFDEGLYNDIDVSIIDMSGRVVKNLASQKNNSSIFTDDLKSGIYIINFLKNNSKIQSKRLVVN